MNTPILFIIFNRPDNTKRVFDQIRLVKPIQLFVSADGPRKDKPNEDKICQQVREIIKQVDWECEVKTLFSDVNLGCKNACVKAINWFFDNVDAGIILEDDCLPDQSFFPFCEELLIKYKDNTHIMNICGTNYIKNRVKTVSDSYFFIDQHCKVDVMGPSVWGWASWKRAWLLFDVNLKIYKDIQNKKYYQDIYKLHKEFPIFIQALDLIIDGKLDAWDCQWNFAKYINHGLSIIPSVNLITNIGFDGTGVLFNKKHSNIYSLQSFPMRFPLKHPRINYV